MKCLTGITLVQALAPFRAPVYLGIGGVWGMMVGWVLVEILDRIPLIWAVAPVRAHSFLGFWGCLRVWGGVGRGRGLFGQFC